MRNGSEVEGAPREGRKAPRLVLRPLQAFLETEYAGGLLLLAATVIALVWANSPWSGAYDRLWHAPMEVRVGDLTFSEDLRGWINDALMALFFYVVGLEIKRELITGELRDPRAAALPVLGAIGGMVGPALIYLAVNAGGESRGWAIPMATDIAFALGALSVVGKSVPPVLRAFLLALAIVDDIGAVVVIALFYSGAISWPALALAGGLLLLMAGLLRLRVRGAALYVAIGMVVWLATLQSGVHATMAGVALGLLTPAKPFRRPVSPLARMEFVLHPWTSFVVVPLFALANAGVSVSPSAISAAISSPVTAGVVAGLVIGKPIGIITAAWLGTRIGIARLPDAVRWIQLAGVGALAGIGFTVSLFITQLAFASEPLQDAARIGILAASLLAAGLGAAALAAAARRARAAVATP